MGMKKYLVGFLIGALAVVSVGAFFYFRPRHDPVQTELPRKTVVESPSREQKRQADVKLSKESETRLSGKTHTPITSLLKPGDSVEVPVAGFVSTTYLDDAGKEIGQGEHQVTGTTTVTLQDDGGIKADTQFEDSVEVAITAASEADKRWHVGVIAGIDTHGDFDRTIYGQYDALKLSVKRFDVVVPIRAEWTAGEGCRVMAGVEVRF
jgi:hypothetical protein